MRTKLTVIALLLAAALLAACGASGSTANVSASPQAGSFVAFCPAIHVRFWAPPAVMPSANPCQGNSLFLTTNITNTGGDEYLTVFRYSGDTRGQSAAGWRTS